MIDLGDQDYQQFPFNKSLLPITKTETLIPKEILFLNSIIADKHESTLF